MSSPEEFKEEDRKDSMESETISKKIEALVKSTDPTFWVPAVANRGIENFGPRQLEIIK